MEILIPDECAACQRLVWQEGGGECAACKNAYCSAGCHAATHTTSFAGRHRPPVELYTGGNDDPVPPMPLTANATQAEIDAYRDAYTTYVCALDKLALGDMRRPTNPMDRLPSLSKQELLAIKRQHLNATGTMATAHMKARGPIRSYLTKTYESLNLGQAHATIDALEKKLHVCPVPGQNEKMLGVFARQAMGAHQVIGLYGGEAWSEEQLNRLHMGACAHRSPIDGWRICGNTTWRTSIPSAPKKSVVSITGLHGGNMLRYLRGSDRAQGRANVRAFIFWHDGAPRVLYYTVEDVQANEELRVLSEIEAVEPGSTSETDLSPAPPRSPAARGLRRAPVVYTAQVLEAGVNQPRIFRLIAHETVPGRRVGEREFYRFKAEYEPDRDLVWLTEETLVQGRGIYHPALAAYLGTEPGLARRLPLLSETAPPRVVLLPDPELVDAIVMQQVVGHRYLPQPTEGVTRYHYMFKLTWSNEETTEVPLEALLDANSPGGVTPPLLTYLHDTMNIDEGNEDIIKQNTRFLVQIIRHYVNPDDGNQLVLYCRSNQDNIVWKVLFKAHLLQMVVSASGKIRRIEPTRVLSRYLEDQRQYGTPASLAVLERFIQKATRGLLRYHIANKTVLRDKT